MRRFILKRVLLALVTVIGVSIIVFYAARLSGDVAVLLAPSNATEEDIQNIRVQLGLDKPIVVQYYSFVKDAVHGDFGDSIRYDKPVFDLILNRVPATLELGLVGFSLALVIGILFGVLASTKRGTILDWSGRIFAMVGQSIPNFWTGIMLILLFGVILGWLPTSGAGGIKNLIMPAFSMAWFSISAIMRITRSSMLDVLDSEYIKLARIKGNLERTVIWKHALRNAIIPVVALSGLQLASLIGGQVIIESVFRWPGIGSLMLEAINSRDYALIQAGVLLVAVGVITVNLLVDLLFGLIDPRIRYE
jgi:peptide/nickel transport system permease protein